MKNFEITSSSVENWNSKRSPEIRTFASGQYICEMSYYLANQAPLPDHVRILNDDGKFYQYGVKPISLKPGLVAYILVPENKTSGQDVKVVFRGTDFADFNSTLINLEHGGPGVESFEQDKDTIMAALKDALTDSPNHSLSVYGHSQGASLAQLFIAEFLKRQYIDEDFSEINSLKMTVLNSPGVPPNTARKAEYYANAIKEDNPLYSIVANYGMVGGDPVQVTGLDMIFANSPPSLAKVNLLKVDRGLEGNWSNSVNFEDGIDFAEIIQMMENLVTSVKAHQNVNFFAPMITDDIGRIIVDLPEKNRSYYSNDTVEGAMKLRLELLNKILIPSYGFYLATEALSKIDLGYLADFVPSGVCDLSKKLLTWFTPKPTGQFDMNNNEVLVQQKNNLK